MSSLLAFPSTGGHVSLKFILPSAPRRIELDEQPGVTLQVSENVSSGVGCFRLIPCSQEGF